MQAGRQQDLSSCSPLRLYRRAAGATNKGVLVARQSARLGARHHPWRASQYRTNGLIDGLTTVDMASLWPDAHRATNAGRPGL